MSNITTIIQHWFDNVCHRQMKQTESGNHRCCILFMDADKAEKNDFHPKIFPQNPLNIKIFAYICSPKMPVTSCKPTIVVAEKQCNGAFGLSVLLQDSRLNDMGLTGFDSRMRWYVSTRSVGGWLLNLSYQKFNWRKQLRSRCLIEVQ